jgi:opacity protein-like surface antigen
LFGSSSACLEAAGQALINKGLTAMGKVKALLFVSASAIAAATGARAADMLPPPVHMPAPAYAPAEFSGWYLRGDAGIGVSGSTKHKSAFAAGGPVIPGFAVIDTRIDQAALVGAGLGYKFNNWFRADVTGEWRGAAAYNSINRYTGGGGSPCIECYDVYRASIGGGAIFANGYFDLGTWAGVTPYVGAGVGGAYHKFSTITDQNPTAPGGFGIGRSNDRFSFAWALMAGLAYTVNRNLTMEIGYRYADLGKAEAGAIACANVGGGFCYQERQSVRVTSHDLRFGMRWHFAEAPMAPPPPLVSKY